MRIVLTAGARPNFVKVAPVLTALEEDGFDIVLVHTGQHYGSEMSEVLFEDLGMRRPDHHLRSGSGSHATQTAAVMIAFEQLLEKIQPDAVLVPGDVNSTMACALVAAKSGCIVGHVEAGMRSGDWTMPEEINRVVTDRVSDLLFASSEDAADNLRREGYRDDQIHIVGNVMVDSLLANMERARLSPILDELGLDPLSYGVVTLHRPSNVDESATLGRLLAVLGEVADRVPLVLPAHPRAAARIRAANHSPNLRVVRPLRYLDFLALESCARLVLTDSGGVQEETTVLGIPCLTLRSTTERPITVEEGTNRVVGTDRGAILAATDDALAGRFPRQRPDLWDGKASERISDVMAGLAGALPRPTERGLLPLAGFPGSSDPPPEVA